MSSKRKGPLALVVVINRRKDLQILMEKGWYRIPVKYAPKRKPAYLAFYQTCIFGREGKAIRYYAPIRSYSVVRRSKLLPDEKDHPRANQYYYKFNLGKIRRTNRVIHNDSRRRISFGFTTMTKLQQSQLICKLFDIVPLEDIMYQAFQKSSLKVVREHCIMQGKRCRFRLDFAIFCRRGKIALECDNEKWHSTPGHRVRDRKRDRYLRKHEWVVLHLYGKEIQKNIDGCLETIKKVINKLGGLL